MWITLRFAPSYPHIHSYYFVAPANWGHLYFGKQGTFLLWVDRTEKKTTPFVKIALSFLNRKV
jgi:hypothetical protein